MRFRRPEGGVGAAGDRPSLISRSRRRWDTASPQRRLVIVLATVVVIGAGAVVASGGGKSNTAPQVGPSPHNTGSTGDTGNGGNPGSGGSGGYTQADQTAYINQCESGPQPQFSPSVCECAWSYIEQNMPPSLYHQQTQNPGINPEAATILSDALNSCRGA